MNPEKSIYWKIHCSYAPHAPSFRTSMVWPFQSINKGKERWMSIFYKLDILEHLISSEHAPRRSIRSVLYRLFLGTLHGCLEIHLPLIFYIISKGHWVCEIQCSCSLKTTAKNVTKSMASIQNSYFKLPPIVNFFTLRRGLCSSPGCG